MEIKKINSIRTKLSISLCIIVLLIISILIFLNNFVLGKFYLSRKKNNLKDVYSTINQYYNNDINQEEIIKELDKISISNNFDILIKTNTNDNIYISNKDFFPGIFSEPIITNNNKSQDLVIEEGEKYVIRQIQDKDTNNNFIMLASILDNGYNIFIRMPMESIEESVKISNQFLYVIVLFFSVFGGIGIFIISKRFSKPIEELDEIAKKMANLDFSQKYKALNSHDEIDNLGKSINELSTKFETTIKQLRKANLELEKDVEEKSQIDEMRKSFISDVSHELKTPIALIQGYSEGLIEDVNTDEESRKFYAEVIQDEATKMDKLVKRLLELMKLEYGGMKFNNKEFNIVELENEIIRKSTVMMEKEEVILENKIEGEITVFADDFYIDQVLTNYITNAIKYSIPINGKRKIRVENEILKDKKKVRVKVFNTFNQFSEEEMLRIWNRFYKVDESRNRENGGNGIGLSLVKAIMNNYGNSYGVKNVVGGVEFYFELDMV